MTDKELRRLSRLDLIEIIYRYQKRESKLEAENKLLRARLKSKLITVKDAGSIAQASLELNKVFDAAQRAADQYLISVKASVGGGARRDMKSDRFRKSGKNS